MEAKGANRWESVWDASEVVALCLAVAINVGEAFYETSELEIMMIWFGWLRHVDEGGCAKVKVVRIRLVDQ